MVQGGREARAEGSQVGRGKALRDWAGTHKAGEERARETAESEGSTGPGRPLRSPSQGLTGCAVQFGKISVLSGSWNGANKGAGRQGECLGAAAGRGKESGWDEQGGHRDGWRWTNGLGQEGKRGRWFKGDFCIRWIFLRILMLSTVGKKRSEFPRSLSRASKLLLGCSSPGGGEAGRG